MPFFVIKESPMDDKKLIELGTCFKPHGIKGGFSFHLHNITESILKKGVEIFLIPKDATSNIPKEGKSFKIKSIKISKKTIAYLEDVEDRNIVEAMLPFGIFKGREEFPKAEEGEYYLSDLEGLDVVDFETGRTIGKVDKYADNGAQVYIEIKGEINFDIPLVDAFVKEVNVEENKIFVLVPEYIDED